jgi:uncharacterized protein YehS (DUF1456 family)
LFKSEGESGYRRCEDKLMGKFLDGLVISRRGPRDEAEGQRREPPPPPPQLGNNEILKRIRIALALKDEELVAIMGLAGVSVSKSEISALFRKSGHHNYRPCGDQFLRNFLVGLTAKHRP